MNKSDVMYIIHLLLEGCTVENATSLMVTISPVVLAIAELAGADDAARRLTMYGLLELVPAPADTDT